MATRLDVAGRMAEAATAVDTTQDYVWACRLLDYQHPDLTMHAAQVRDWFDSEEGLDLRVLDADCASLRAVAATVDQALDVQRAQSARLASAWHGAGAQSAARCRPGQAGPESRQQGRGQGAQAVGAGDRGHRRYDGHAGGPVRTGHG